MEIWGGMMEPKLLNRLRQIPNGFVFTQPQTGWDAVKVLGKHPSFDRLVDALVAHRKGNPWVCHKHQLVTDRLAVAEEVDLYNAKICLANGWTDFIVNTEASPPKYLPQLPEGGGAVAAVKRVAVPVKLAIEWFGNDLLPVEVTLAEKRALICSKCPKNDPDPTLFQRIGAVAAEKLRKLIEFKHNLSLRTSVDDKLHTCSSCDCHLPLKIWTPLKHVLAITSEETKAKLHPDCWILRHDQ